MLFRSLQGVGAPNEFVSPEVAGMEILFELHEGHALPPALAAAVAIGARYRLEVPEADLYSTLDRLRGCEARILSITPVRPTLEDYFIRIVGREQTPVHAVEGMAR